MDLAYTYYQLTPVKQLNRFERKTFEGMLLKVDESFYLDYFPWKEFGDLSIDDFLAKLRDDKELPTFMLRDLSLEKEKNNILHRSFLNHGPMSGTVKLKFKNSFEALAQEMKNYENCKIKIDFNSGATLEEVLSFWNNLENTDMIEYLEDPCPNAGNEWFILSQNNIPLACDREKVDAKDYKWKVVKPNRDDVVTTSGKKIFSNYMGHDLGIYHCYLALMKYGNLEEFHGIANDNLYKDQIDLFEVINGRTKIKRDELARLYKKLAEQKWKKIF